MAAVLRVPLVLIMENNQYAFSTPLEQQYAGETLVARAPSYGIPGTRVDGNDVVAVWKAVSQAVARARRGAGPALIEAVVGRLRGHSEGDDSLDHVPEEDLRRYRSSDPVTLFEARLAADWKVSTDYLEEVQERSAALVLETVDRALASPDPKPDGKDRAIHAE